MNMTSEQLIVHRLKKELKGFQRIALGQGIPSLVKPFLPKGITCIDLNGVGLSDKVDLAVVEALEVSRQGDLAARVPSEVAGLQADRWIVVIPHQSEEGLPRIVETCHFPVQQKGCVNLIVTDLGVIEVNDVGFELKELAPGVASDDVRRQVRASLHVADDIRLMDL